MLERDDIIATLKNGKVKARKINNLEIKAPNSRNNTINIKKVDKIKLNESKTNFHIHEVKKERKRLLRKRSFYIALLLVIVPALFLFYIDQNVYINLLVTILSISLSYIIALLE